VKKSQNVASWVVIRVIYTVNHILRAVLLVFASIYMASKML